MATLKTCKGCGNHLAAGEYYAHPSTLDRLQPQCKTCMKGATTRRRIETNYAAQRKYEKSERGRAMRFAHDQARMQLHYAIRTGKLIPLPCWECGAKAEAHHPDYGSPLDVVWLCSLHHKQLHAMAAA